MDYTTTTLFLLISLIFTCIHFFIKLLGIWQSSATVVRLPPGPYPLPVLGNIFKLGEKPHHSLAALSKTYGPLMTLKIGSRTMIVVSSPEMAKQVFNVHDRSFSARPIPDAIRMMDHHKLSMGWIPVGDQWGRLRKIAKEYLLSAQQLDSGQLLRLKKVQDLLNHVDECCTNGTSLNIGLVASTTILNVLSNFIFSTDLAHYDSLTSQEFKDTVSALMGIIGKPNLSDIFPVLKPFDPQGLLRQANFYADKLMSIFDRIINRRLQERANASAGYPLISHDALDLMLDLSLKEESGFNQNHMRHLFLDVFMAGTDTTSSTFEWAMTELIRNPGKMLKARLEIEEIIGKGKVFEEGDISRLPYLQAVVKETFRLHPPAPLLVPHKALTDVEIQGFIVPKDAEIVCNTWGIGRDPAIWLNPHKFVPERFLDNEIDFKGQNLELIPFGSGRRICPGLPLAHRMLHLMLGSLICKYDWKLEGEMSTDEIDMSEKFGIALCKNVPLMAVPIKI